MRKSLSAVLLLLVLGLAGHAALAEEKESTVYTIQPGDTLWGISQRFLNDPYHWPDLWSKNPAVTNPHFIYPGQKLKIGPDRIEIVQEPTAPAPAAVPPGKEQPVPTVAEVTVPLTGAEGFLLEKEPVPAGTVIATNSNRLLVGEGDTVYTDLGTQQRVKGGDRFAIYRQLHRVSHPVLSGTVGYKIAPLGFLTLDEVKEKTSRALIVDSYSEIGSGDYLLPYLEPRRTVALKAATRNLKGYIVESQKGMELIGAGDIVYLDLGARQGAAVGNLLYVVRDVEVSSEVSSTLKYNLPVSVIGALVIIDAGDNVATALVVKSTEQIYRGDRVEITAAR